MMPAQQSAVVVQPPVLGTQLVPHTKGEPPGTLFGTHASPQQSALDAQGCPWVVPASGHTPVIVQRGMPRLSCWQSQGCVCTVPAQQRSVALHDVVASLQIAPAGEHLFPLSQRPTGSLAFAFEQCTSLAAPPVGVPGAPQQSLSIRQSSPVGRHPVGGSQMKTPVGAYGAHARLQQLPPHAGRPPSPTVPASDNAPPHASPSTVHIVAPGAEGTLHTPIVIPVPLVQMPPQHSLFVEQMSPVCVQNDDWLEQRPFVQRLEQQFAFDVHALPDVEHPPLSGVHVPPASAPPLPPHRPPQQLAFDVHAWLSEMQSVAPHLP